MDFALTVPQHDIDVSSGDLEILGTVDSIAQNLRIRLQFFLGEWFLDRRLGVPYYQQILVKNPGTNLVRSVFRKAITTTPGVISLDALETDYEGTTRTLTVAFTVTVQGTDEPLDFSFEFIV